jgi:hypothetical protein
MPSKEYYWKNPEKYREESLNYFNNNKDKCLAKMKIRNLENPEINREKVKKWVKNNPRKHSQNSIDSKRKGRGFTKELFNQLLLEQENKCPICGIELSKGLNQNAACADHCHITNQPRGILCKKCNLMLGHANDNIEVLESAIQYLRKYMFKRTA